MGLRCVKPKTLEPVERTPECKILVAGTEFYTSYGVLDLLTSGKVPLANGWSADETSPEKYAMFFPYNNGGRCDNRALFRHGERHADAILYVVDSSVRELDYVKDMLQMLLMEAGLRNAILIVLHNDDSYMVHTDRGRTTLDEVKKAIDFDGIPKSFKATILPCCSNTGEGMEEVVSYLTRTLLSDKYYDMEKIPEVKPKVDKASMIKQVETTLKEIKPIVPESA